MRTSVLCVLALLTLPAVINAQHTPSPRDHSTTQNSTPEVDTTTHISRDPEGATHDEGDDALTNAFHRVLQEAHRIQDQRVSSLMEQPMQERDKDFGVIVDKQVYRLEKTLTVLGRQMNRFTKNVGHATNKGRISIDKMENRLSELEASIERVLEHVGLAPLVPVTEPSAEQDVSTSPQPPAGEEATELELTEEEQLARQRVQIRLQEVKEKTDRARSEPSTLGADLCAAARMGLADEVRHLLDAGADVNYVNTDGVPSLLCAFYLPPIFFPATPDVVALLIERGADVNATTEQGTSALLAAIFFEENKRCVEMLLSAGADVDVRDKEGATPLHYAVSNAHGNIVRVLLAAGARKDLRSWSGEWKNKTAMDLAPDVYIKYLLMD